MTDQIIGILSNLENFINDKETAKASIIDFIKNSETNIFSIIQNIDYTNEYKLSLNQLFKFMCENMIEEDLKLVAKMYFVFITTFKSPSIEIKLDFIYYTCITWFDNLNFMSILLSENFADQYPLSFLQFIISCIKNPIVNPAYYKNLDQLVQLFEFFLINYKDTFVSIYEKNITNMSFDETKYDNLNALNLNEAKMSYYFTNIRVMEKLWTSYSNGMTLNECLDNRYDYLSSTSCKIDQYDVLSKIERETSIMECLFYSYSTLVANVYLTALSKKDRLLHEISYYEGMKDLYNNPFAFQQYNSMQEYYYEYSDYITDNMTCSVAKFYNMLSYWIRENIDTLYSNNTLFFDVMIDNISLYLLFSYKENRYDVSEIIQLSLKITKNYNLISNPHTKIRLLKNIYNYVLKNEDGLIYIYFDYFKNDILHTLINFYVNIEFNNVSLERNKINTRFIILHFIHFLKDSYAEHYSEQFKLFKEKENSLYNKFIYMVLSESNSILNELFKYNVELMETEGKLNQIKEKFDNEKLMMSETIPNEPMLNFENVQNGNMIQVNLNNLNNLNNLQNIPGLNQNGIESLQNLVNMLHQLLPQAQEPQENAVNVADPAFANIINLLNDGLQPQNVEEVVVDENDVMVDEEDDVMVDEEVDEDDVMVEDVVIEETTETMTEQQANTLYRQYMKTIKYVNGQIDLCYDLISEMFELIIYLESNSDKCFVTEEIADHLAEILSYYLSKITNETKGEQMMKTLLYIAKMYSLLIANDIFVQTVKNNIELFSLTNINTLITSLTTYGLLNDELNGKLNTLIVMIDGFKNDKSNMNPIDIAYENNDLPDKFCDSIFCVPIRTPVILPTSNLIMDEVYIKRYLISNHTDPTNREPLTSDTLDEFNGREEIRVKLAEFIKERDDWISNYVKDKQ